MEKLLTDNVQMSAEEFTLYTRPKYLTVPQRFVGVLWAERLYYRSSIVRNTIQAREFGLRREQKPKIVGTTDAKGGIGWIRGTRGLNRRRGSRRRVGGVVRAVSYCSVDLLSKNCRKAFHICENCENGVRAIPSLGVGRGNLRIKKYARSQTHTHTNTHTSARTQ